MHRKLFPILFSGLLGACTQPATLHTLVTDSPLNDAGVEQVNVDVQDVSVHVGSTWRSLMIAPETVDLMVLRNGVTTELGVQTLPAGHYAQIRLITGTSNSIVVNGDELPLVVPSGSQTGVTIPFQFDVLPGGSYDLTLDFVADESVVHTGNGRWILKPVVRVASFTQSGADTGQTADSGGADDSGEVGDTGEHDTGEHDTGEHDTGD